jgi:hypothetical protein
MNPYRRYNMTNFFSLLMYLKFTDVNYKIDILKNLVPFLYTSHFNA